MAAVPAQRGWHRPTHTVAGTGTHTRARINPYTSLAITPSMPLPAKLRAVRHKKRHTHLPFPCFKPKQIAGEKEIGMSAMPSDVLRLVFKCLGTEDKRQCSLVCREWAWLLRDALLWQDEVVGIGVRVTGVWNLLNHYNWNQLKGLRVVGQWDEGRCKVWSFLSHCTALELLDLSGAVIDDGFVSELKCTGLQRVIADKTKGLGDGALARLLAISPGLREVFVEDSAVTDSVLGTMAVACPKLEALSLRWCGLITNLGLRAVVERCTRLHSVDLSGCCSNVNDATVMAIVTALHHQLLFLDVSCCAGVTDRGVSFLAAYCHRIATLRLSMCRRVTDEGIAHIARQCVMLEEISLAGCKHIGDKSVTVLAQSCHRLHTLDLVWCGGLTNHGILHIARRWSSRKLQCLGISGCRSISDLAIGRLGDGCPGLRAIEIESCESLTDGGVRLLASTCQLLQHINLSRCLQITDNAVKAIATFCAHLRVLRLCGCQKVTDVGVGALVARCVNIKVVHLTGCGAVTMAAFHPLFAKHRARLDELDVRGCTLLDHEDARALFRVCSRVYFS